MNSSIKDITNEASISVGSFYSFFHNKEEVLTQIFDEIKNLSQCQASAMVKTEYSVTKNYVLGLTTAFFTFICKKYLNEIYARS